jgi:hypothetical protein
VEGHHLRTVSAAKVGGIEAQEKVDQPVALHAGTGAMMPRSSASRTKARSRIISAAKTRRPRPVSL